MIAAVINFFVFVVISSLIPFRLDSLNLYSADASAALSAIKEDAHARGIVALFLVR